MGTSILYVGASYVDTVYVDSNCIDTNPYAPTLKELSVNGYESPKAHGLRQTNPACGDPRRLTVTQERQSRTRRQSGIRGANQATAAPPGLVRCSPVGQQTLVHCVLIKPEVQTVVKERLSLVQHLIIVI